MLFISNKKYFSMHIVVNLTDCFNYHKQATYLTLVIYGISKILYSVFKPTE